MNEPLRIGSRGSELALWQARWVRDRLTVLHPDLAVEIEIIKTKGDRVLDAPLSKIGDKGLFTREIEHALLQGNIRSRRAQSEGFAHGASGGIGIGGCDRA